MRKTGAAKGRIDWLKKGVVFGEKGVVFANKRGWRGTNLTGF
jgi:hypothetical protein